MTEENASFAREGQPAFPENTGEESPAGSQPGNEDGTQGDAPAAGGQPDNSKPNDPNVPFDQHPAWKEREGKWNTRFNEQEERHTAAIDKLRQEFGQQSRPAVTPTNLEVPSWFNGDEDTWKAFSSYQEERDRKVSEAAYSRFKTEQDQLSKLQTEATNWLQSEVAAMQVDKEMNPSGDKIDVNKLLKIVDKYKLIDDKGRWNYRAAYAIMQAETKKPSNNERRILANGGTDSAVDEKQAGFKTAADFKKNRPW